MEYYSVDLIESFQIEDELQIFDNDSIIADIELADKIVMHRWLYHFCTQESKPFSPLFVHLSENMVYNHYKNGFIHTLLIQPMDHQLSIDKHAYQLHRFMLLSNNRICLLSRNYSDYKVDIYEFLKVEKYESEEMLKWLKYKLAYENAPVLFENETDYFNIEIA